MTVQCSVKQTDGNSTGDIYKLLHFLPSLLLGVAFGFFLHCGLRCAVQYMYVYSTLLVLSDARVCVCTVFPHRSGQSYLVQILMHAYYT